MEIAFFGIGAAVGWAITSEYHIRRNTELLKQMKRRIALAEFRERHSESA